jgi:HK97 family phage portal protein
MKIFGREIIIRKQLPSDMLNSIDFTRGWLRVNEPYTGAWQRNDPLPVENILANSTVFRCISLIAADIAKMELQLLQEDADGIGQEIDTSPYLGVLSDPNPHQNSIQFFEQWMFSKLINGNAYILKSRDGRNLVSQMFVLNPGRVRPLVAPDGSVFYQLQQDLLSFQPEENVTVPASEIIHDRMNAFYHPLWGLSPMYANHLPAAQALRILKYSDRFFGNAARPSGVLTAPGVINKETADRLKSHWEQNYTAENSGKVAVLGDGLKFDAMTQNAVDSELVKQLEMSDKKVCTTFGVPAFKVGVEGAPTYDNVEAMDQIYYSGCLQIHIESIERLLMAGLELPSGYYVEFDLDGLLRMDTARKVEAYQKLTAAGILAPNEARAEFDYSPVDGGDTPYLQQQYYPLDKRPGNAPAPPQISPPAPAVTPAAVAKAMLARVRKGLAHA